MAKWEDFFLCSALKKRGYDIFTQISKTPFCLLSFLHFHIVRNTFFFVWNVNAKDFRCVTIRQNRIIFFFCFLKQLTSTGKWVKGKHDNCRDAREENSFFHTQELCVCGCVMASKILHTLMSWNFSWIWKLIEMLILGTRFHVCVVRKKERLFWKI